MEKSGALKGDCGHQEVSRWVGLVRGWEQGVLMWGAQWVRRTGGGEGEGGSELTNLIIRSGRKVDCQSQAVRPSIRYRAASSTEGEPG